MSKMSGPHGYAQAPGMMHKQFDLRSQSQQAEEAARHEQQLGRKKGMRYQDRHTPTSSGSSITANQMLAIFYAALLTSPLSLPTQSSFRPFNPPRAAGHQCRAVPQPKAERTVTPIVPETQTGPGTISRLVDGLASLALGPVAGVLQFSTQVNAQAAP